MANQENNNNKMRIIVTILLVVVALAFGLSYYYSSNDREISDTNINPDHNFEEDYLRENCECVERNNFYCQFNDFSYDSSRGYCVKNNTLVNPIRKCSKYDCDGQIVIIKQESVEN